jgi:glutamate-1-semialdehyde 2,1-aminomutase
MSTTIINRSDAKSAAAFERATAVMPGGVNSPVRAFTAVDRDPVTIRSGKGAVVTDIDGHEYVDYICSYGPLILGHAPEPVLAALSKAASHGTSFGMPTEAETALAKMIIEAVASIDLVRFVNSGTEATMSAIRLARAATGRSKIIKCVGCYHGHSDGLLVEAGSGATTLGVPSSQGVPPSITADTVLVGYNDLQATGAIFADQGDKIAAVIVESIAGNMGCVPPVEGYLQGLADLCSQYGALLIFDEVMSGFRVAYGGAQQVYGITPDLTCLGKVIGGGLPCAAYGGREDLMRQVAPDGPVYQAGTLSGNPLAMAAGLATLEVLRDSDAYEQLEQTSAKFVDGLDQAAKNAGVSVQTSRVGSMIGLFFADEPVENYAQATATRTDRFTAFFGAMLDGGVMLAPSAYETWFVSTAHDQGCIERTLDAAAVAFGCAAAIV